MKTPTGLNFSTWISAKIIQMFVISLLFRTFLDSGNCGISCFVFVLLEQLNQPTIKVIVENQTFSKTWTKAWSPCVCSFSVLWPTVSFLWCSSLFQSLHFHSSLCFFPSPLSSLFALWWALFWFCTFTWFFSSKFSFSLSFFGQSFLVLSHSVPIPFVSSVSTVPLAAAISTGSQVPLAGHAWGGLCQGVWHCPCSFCYHCTWWVQRGAVSYPTVPGTSLAWWGRGPPVGNEGVITGEGESWVAEWIPPHLHTRPAAPGLCLFLGAVVSQPRFLPAREPALPCQ